MLTDASKRDGSFGPAPALLSPPGGLSLRHVGCATPEIDASFYPEEQSDTHLLSATNDNSMSFGAPGLLLSSSILVSEPHETEPAALLDADQSGGFGPPTALLAPAPSFPAPSDKVESLQAATAEAFGNASVLLGTSPTVKALSRSYPAHSNAEAMEKSFTVRCSPSTSAASSNSFSQHCVGSICASTYGLATIEIKRRPRRGAQRSVSSSFSRLLEVPIHRLKEQLSIEQAIKSSKASISSATSAPMPTASAGGELWVDLYRPRKYIDLLGDERVHRETMAWVKEWDWCVFGKKHGRKRPRNQDENIAEVDAYHRPQDKILLLSGPPGLGKTTLAHVVAAQAGYSVHEVNASDARTGLAIEERIRPVLETGYALGSNKPILLVIDEIDGSAGGENAGGFVHKLLSLVYEKSGKKGRKRNGQTVRPVLRPIICICNDLYASSIVKLRQNARIIRFNRPTDVYVVKRLREICDDQSLRADSRALTALVGVCKSDLRACINTLQFVKHNHSEVTESIIRKATTGMKEGDVSFLNVLVDLFLPMNKKRLKEAALADVQATRYVDRLSRQIDASDAYDKVALGCFEHYTQLRQHDANLSCHGKGIEWLLTFDGLEHVIRSQNQYALWPYQAYSLVPFYPLFQEQGSPKPERPKADWDHYVKKKANEEVSKSLVRCLQVACGRLAGHYRHLTSDSILLLEVAPYLNRIINPPLRPINNQISRPEERTVMTRLVDVMLSLDLQFYQEKAEDGQLMYRLDPPIDVFVTYDGKRSKDLAPSRYAVRHAVAAELERQSEARHKTRSRNAYLAHAPVGLKGLRTAVSIAERSATSGYPKVVLSDKIAVDFFGRPITTEGKKKHQETAIVNVDRPVKKSRISYRFHEGNSAAVRRPVKTQAFLS